MIENNVGILIQKCQHKSVGSLVHQCAKRSVFLIQSLGVGRTCVRTHELVAGRYTTLVCGMSERNLRATQLICRQCLRPIISTASVSRVYLLVVNIIQITFDHLLKCIHLTLHVLYYAT